jgi:alkanesulfonate monooxygenase SsuD/methylene tetrahydromethanopterin reductase-like flavin-dependent oxidoreductase (luciferase family)
MTKLGILLEGLPANLTVSYARQAEAAGFGRIWLPEIIFTDAVVPATAAALATEKIELGFGVVGIWARSPVTMALEAATLHAVSNERLVIGLGTQARGYVNNWHNRTYERPLRAMREFITILKGILSGESTTFEGDIFQIRQFQLMAMPPEKKAPIHMAAIGPKMIQLAGEIADGLLGYSYSVEYLRNVVLPNLAIGAERSGRSLDDFDIGLGLPAIVGSDQAFEQIRGQVVMFATALDSSPAYAASFEAAGFGAPAQEIRDRVAAGDLAGALDTVTPQMADAMTIIGSGDHARERVVEYFEAGATSVVLNPAAPGTLYPLYEGHFPADADLPEFDFPAYLGVIEGTIAAMGESSRS